jgi:hypothetical protein
LFEFFIERGYRGFDVFCKRRWRGGLTLRLRPVKSMKELFGDEDPKTSLARNVLWLPKSGARFDPSAYLYSE